MNREQWYKQRRLYRLKWLVYNSWGDTAPPKAYEATLKFPDTISKCWVGSTYGYDVKHGMSLLSRVKEASPERVHQFKDTLRYMMRSNANMARITRCGSTPFDWFRGFN